MNNIGWLTSNTINNELYTPYYAVEPILKYIPKDKIIWCGFDMECSAYYQLLKRNGYNVVRSCIQEGKDFFKYEPERWDIFISNPPFSLKDKVIERLYSFNKPFAILLPLNSLQGKTRFNYFSQGIQMLSFDSRIAFHNPYNMKTVQKGTPFASAYFCRYLLPQDLMVEHLEENYIPLRENDIYMIRRVMCKIINRGSN